jgi:hypothetical protein
VISCAFAREALAVCPEAPVLVGAVREVLVPVSGGSGLAGFVAAPWPWWWPDRKAATRTYLSRGPCPQSPRVLRHTAQDLGRMGGLQQLED